MAAGIIFKVRYIQQLIQQPGFFLAGRGGSGGTDYITRLTYILFLKMDDEKKALDLSSYLSEGSKWKDLCTLSGTGSISRPRR